MSLNLMCDCVQLPLLCDCGRVCLCVSVGGSVRVCLCVCGRECEGVPV